MHSKIITRQEEVWVCDTCGFHHTEERDGKWEIFHCPEHGEFCNGLGESICGIFRYKASRHSISICCPICGWCVDDYKQEEPYDNRVGSKPKDKNEIKSFKSAQKYLLENSHAFSGNKSFIRLKNFTLYGKDKTE